MDGQKNLSLPTWSAELTTPTLWLSLTLLVQLTIRSEDQAFEPQSSQHHMGRGAYDTTWAPEPSEDDGDKRTMFVQQMAPGP